MDVEEHKAFWEQNGGSPRPEDYFPALRRAGTPPLRRSLAETISPATTPVSTSGLRTAPASTVLERTPGCDRKSVQPYSLQYTPPPLWPILPLCPVFPLADTLTAQHGFIRGAKDCKQAGQQGAQEEEHHDEERQEDHEE